MHAHKTKEHHSQPAANAVSAPLKDGAASLPFPDNRPEKHLFDRIKTLSAQASPTNVIQRVIGKTAKVGDHATSRDGSIWKIDEVSSDGGKVQYKISQVSGKHHLWNPRVVNPDDEGWDLLPIEEDSGDTEMTEEEMIAVEALATITGEKNLAKKLSEKVVSGHGSFNKNYLDLVKEGSRKKSDTFKVPEGMEIYFYAPALRLKTM